MFKVGSFYPERKKIMPRGSGNKSQKSSLDAPKLTATSAKSKGEVLVINLQTKVNLNQVHLHLDLTRKMSIQLRVM